MSQRRIRHYWCFDLSWCFTEESQFLGWNHIQVRASPPFRIQQTAKVSMLTETTLKQLDVLSEIVWLMCKPNKRSERLKANIVGWTPSAVSVNLSFSELQPKQIQILRSGHESRRRYVRRHAHTHTERQYTQVSGPVWCSCVALWVMSWGMRRGRAGSELCAAPLFTLMVSRC